MKEFNNLGRYQRHLLKDLAEGHWIKSYQIYSDKKWSLYTIMKEENEVSGVKDNTLFRIALESFIKRGLLSHQVIYTTVQPDTETIRYDLKEEYIEHCKTLK